MPSQFIQALIEEDILAFGGFIYASGLDDSMIYPGYLYGFALANPSTTTITVGPATGTAGYAMDSTNVSLITLAAQVTVTISTNAAIQGNDSFTGPGTVSVTSALFAVTGVSTTFLTSFGTRAGSGTASNSTTTITGTGSKFLSQAAVGDLIGNASAGYAQITAIASDTSLTTVSAVTLSGAAYNIIENPTIKIDTNTVVQVSAIASNTALTISNGASATKSGVAYSIGQPSAASTQPAANFGNMALWVGTGASGTGCYCSTQRTTPFGITNYNANFRRIGSFLTTAGVIVPFDQFGIGVERWYQFEIATGASPLRVLTAGTATAWTSVVCGAAAPPSANCLMVRFAPSGSVGNFASIRKRNAGDTSLTRNVSVSCTTAGGSTVNIGPCACDGAQCIDYVNTSALLNTYLDVCGYGESL